MTADIPLFVYGTLRSGGSNDIARLVPGSRRLGTARLAGRLYDVGTYPHLVLDAQAPWVVGELVAVPEAGWPVLDTLEHIVREDRPDGEYFKRHALLENGQQVVVYEGNPAVLPTHTLIACGDWLAYAATKGVTAFTRTPRSMKDAPPMQTARWYFDLISPYAYLHWKRLPVLRDRLDISPVPVLFGGVLKAWGHKGPAEIPVKRLQTYRACVFTAARQGVPFRFPPAHPFNPLQALRLVTALRATPEVVECAFQFVWGEGRDPSQEFEAFAQACGCASADAAHALIEETHAKQTLLDSTEEAVSAGLYGVPTLALGGHLFWGNDMLEMTEAWLANPALFESAEMVRVATLPVGIARKA
jgi:2-hydroxychromene-2-carboxylate isomerase/gamma-glutamylcyclotransferase (GGCT)/AIG2-like uncharacterized protein YtfP